jgi:hypothetical protein
MAQLVKFKMKPVFVHAMRITDEAAGPVGHWLVVQGEKQELLSNGDFLAKYQPAGKGRARELYTQASVEAGKPA